MKYITPFLRPHPLVRLNYLTLGPTTYRSYHLKIVTLRTKPAVLGEKTTSTTSQAPNSHHCQSSMSESTTCVYVGMGENCSQISLEDPNSLEVHPRTNLNNICMAITTAMIILRTQKRLVFSMFCCLQEKSSCTLVKSVKFHMSSSISRSRIWPQIGWSCMSLTVNSQAQYGKAP